MQLTIRSIGQKNQNELKTEIDNYIKRIILPYSLKFEVIPHVKHRNPEQQRTEEGKKLLKDIPPNSLLIATKILGKSYSTEEFYELIQSKDHKKAFLFIGGCHGLSQEVIDICHISWSLSKLTLTHAHARLLVAEQWYRISCIHNQHPYHK